MPGVARRRRRTSLILPQVQDLIRATGADIRIGGDKAYYDVAGDYIRVPPPQAFYEPINWHRTAVHELSHWSGAPNRLARDLSGSFGSKLYIFEELCVELSSAYVCSTLGVAPTVRHADYIGAWIDLLTDQDRAIVRAASAASKAADYLLAFRDRQAGAAGDENRDGRLPGADGRTCRPCIVRTDGLPEEDSLAENVQRAPLLPLDQFRAFLALREKGRSEEEIAAAFFVSAHVVRQRLRLASVSPRLLEVYAEDGMSLDQLMAFTVNPDHARQAEVWEALQRTPIREPYQIRRLLTESAVRASDKRAQFVGIADYEAAGGTVLRDLFEADDGGWLQDPGLLDRLVAEKLEREAGAVRAEGWRWVEVAPDFPYGHTYGLRRLSGKEVALTKRETRARDALKAELDKLEKEYADAEEIPEEVDGRLGEIETALEEYEQRPVVYDASEVARAGAFVSIDASGALRVERGYVRPEDEAPVSPPDEEEEHETGDGRAAGASTNGATAPRGSASRPADPAAESDEDEGGVRLLSDRLMTELTAHRTLALRQAVANDPDTAFLAMLHALTLKLFYRFGFDSCLEIEAKSVLFGTQVEGLGDMPYATAIDARHGAWAAQLPKDTADLWDVLCSLDSDSRQALFAHCVGLTINATCQPYDRRPKAIAHADQVAEAVGLDMAAAGWRPSVAGYLGRVTKARILEAVREAKGEQAARLIADLKKAEMAREAERLLEGTGWLPEPLRLRGVEGSGSAGDAESLPAFLAADSDDGQRAVAAE